MTKNDTKLSDLFRGTDLGYGRASISANYEVDIDGTGKKKILNLGQEFPNCKEYVGIEIEVEGVPALEWHQALGFGVVNEPSIRGGYEFVSLIGLNAQEVIHHTRELHKLLKDGKFSFRCGLHVHINVHSHTLEELYRVFLAYSLLEKLLFRASGNRYDNRFCVAVQESISPMSKLIHYGHTGQWEKFYQVLKAFRADRRETTKYMALNVVPVVNYGSLEFRHHYGTSDPGTILKWMQILLDVVVSTKRLSTQELESQILGVNTISFYEELLCDLLPNSNLFISREKFERFMYDGVLYIKECFIGEGI